MLVIGLTGGIGSGKSTVAELFAAKGIAIIDTDLIARDVVKPGQPALKAIVHEFGHDILQPDQSLDRNKLKKIIFSDPAKRQWLEKLLHPLIREHMQNQINQATSPYCIAVIPLLVETLPNPSINRILVIDTSLEEQLKRIATRDQMQENDARAIIDSQISREMRLAAADDHIINNGSLTDLKSQVDSLHQFYLTLAAA